MPKLNKCRPISKQPQNDDVDLPTFKFRLIIFIYNVYIFRVKRGIMSTLTLISDFGQINEVEKFKFDVIECLYNYAIIHNINL